MAKHTVQFLIDENKVKEFNELNKSLWDNANAGNRYIYVNFSMVRMQVAWMLPKLLYAEALAKKNNATIIVLVWDTNELFNSFIHSFGAKVICLNELCRRYSDKAVPAGLKTLWYELFDGTGEGLQKLKAAGICPGKDIYEDILRTSDYSTIRTGRTGTCFKKIVHLLWVLYALDRFLNKYKPLYCIDDDVAYHESAFEKLFAKHGAKLCIVNNYVVRDVPFDEQGEIIRERTAAVKRIRSQLNEITDEDIKWTEQHLIEKFLGKNGREIDRVAFKDKKDVNREEISEKLGLDTSKKNVVIMAHTFTDAIFNQGSYPYKDYYEWMEETLRLASGIDSVNWIFKPHPSRVNYNESKDSIEALFEKYKTKNMFMLPDEMGGKTVRDMTDIIITIGSNAAIEYACYGIPAVLLGKPFFYGFGFTTDVSTKEEYINILKNITDIKPLDEEKTRLAKGVYYLYNGRVKPNAFDDEFVEVCNRKHKEMHEKMASRYFGTDEGTKDYNTASLVDIMDYMKSHDIKQTQYYTRALENE